MNPHLVRIIVGWAAPGPEQTQPLQAGVEYLASVIEIDRRLPERWRHSRAT